MIMIMILAGNNSVIVVQEPFIYYSTKMKFKWPLLIQFALKIKF